MRNLAFTRMVNLVERHNGLQGNDEQRYYRNVRRLRLVHGTSCRFETLLEVDQTDAVFIGMLDGRCMRKTQILKADIGIMVTSMVFSKRPGRVADNALIETGFGFSIILIISECWVLASQRF